LVLGDGQANGNITLVKRLLRQRIFCAAVVSVSLQRVVNGILAVRVFTWLCAWPVLKSSLADCEVVGVLAVNKVVFGKVAACYHIEGLQLVFDGHEFEVSDGALVLLVFWHTDGLVKRRLRATWDQGLLTSLSRSIGSLIVFESYGGPLTTDDLARENLHIDSFLSRNLHDAADIFGVFMMLNSFVMSIDTTITNPA
jgi:hypothetical protein